MQLRKKTGAIAERRSYDAYGARRNPKWGEPLGVLSSKTTRGYTGHEEDDDLGLVNMPKGGCLIRVSQGLRRRIRSLRTFGTGKASIDTAYVNNPLSFVDPTGFVPQTIVVPPELDYIDQVVETAYPDGFKPVPIPEPELDPLNALESTSSLRFTTDVGTTGNGAGGLPQETTNPEPSSWRENPFINGIGGFAVGLLEGIVPGAALGYGAQDALGEHDGMMRQARIGRSLGQIFGGAITAGIGLMGEAAATGFILTGVGSVVGVPVAAVSTVAVIGGTANVIAGFQGLAKLMTGGGGTRGPPSGSQPSPSKGWRVGDDIYKPTASGAKPNWSTVRARYWKNAAAENGAERKWGANNAERMKRGLAPQKYNEKKGGMESMDLSHEPTPAREGGTNLVERWPQDHANVDSFRRPGY
jgi:hypothetical protein